MEYYFLFEQLLKEFNQLSSPDCELVRPTLAKLCGLLRIAKIWTVAYPDENAEKLGRGEELLGFDGGKKCVRAMNKKLVTPLMSIVDCNVYIEEGQPEWTDEERNRISMIVETITVYVSRLTILSNTESYLYLDSDGYRNTRSFVRHVQMLAREDRLIGMAAVHFNLKHFSLVNQQVGREAGDLVMKTYYNDLCASIKGRGIVCRFGGDNFALLCDKWELDSILGQLSGKAVVYDPDTGDRVMVSASVGVFMIPDNFTFKNPGDIIDKAIAASTAARTRGTEDIVFFSEAMIAIREKTMRIQRVFPEALANEEFKVFYQPKIDINTGELSGAEALCRWFRNGKIVPPMEFIPVLEQSMDICKLDFYMLDHVCKDIRRWLDEGKRVVRVSVNLSRKHMAEVDLLEHIMKIINRNCVPHEYIEIELTETTTDVEFRDIKRIVNELQKAGIKTAVDDFGMGYSSLNLIKEIPWNVLKVDKSFLPLDSEKTEAASSVMFKYVVAMARELGLECIAEGVETQTQVELMRENGCDLAQGFLFDKPLPVNEFEDRLVKHIYKVR